MYFWLPRPLWWRQDVLNGQMRYEIIPPTHTLSKYEKKLAIPIHPNGLFIGMFLPIYAMYYKNRAYGRLSWTDAHSVFNSDKELNMVSNFLGKIWGIFGQKLLRRNYFSFGPWRTKTCKNACFAWFFMKCL